MPGTNDEVSGVNSPPGYTTHHKSFALSVSWVLLDIDTLSRQRKEASWEEFPQRLFLSTCLSTTDWHIGANPNGQVSAELASGPQLPQKLLLLLLSPQNPLLLSPQKHCKPCKLCRRRSRKICKPAHHM